MIHVRQAVDLDNVVLEFSGLLDTSGAEALVAIALQQPPAVCVVIDISHASVIHDVALGHLIDALPRSRTHTVRGAGRHQARLLKYLGERIDEG